MADLIALDARIREAVLVPLPTDVAAQTLQSVFRGFLTRRSAKGRQVKAHLQAQKSCATPKSPFVPSTHGGVDQFLALAEVGAGDVVLDVGCGDGRVLVAAAKLGARALGIEYDDELCTKARSLAEAAGLASLVEVQCGDVRGPLMAQLLKRATVVFLFMLPVTNVYMQELLLSCYGEPEEPSQLLPGRRRRVVTNTFRLKGWPISAEVPLQKTGAAQAHGPRLYLYRFRYGSD